MCVNQLIFIKNVITNHVCVPLCNVVWDTYNINCLKLSLEIKIPHTHPKVCSGNCKFVIMFTT